MSIALTNFATIKRSLAFGFAGSHVVTIDTRRPTGTDYRGPDEKKTDPAA